MRYSWSRRWPINRQSPRTQRLYFIRYTKSVYFLMFVILHLIWFANICIINIGAFRVEMQRENQKDRTILCKFDPTEPGDYRVEVKWAGEHVPGSPFMVMIFDTQEELNRFLQVCYAILFSIFIIINSIICFRAIIRQQDLIYIVVLIIHQVMLTSHLNHCY